MRACRYCGTALAPDGGCPACDDAGELLTTVEIEPRELGVRSEDEFVSLPGTDAAIRRRVHRPSSATQAPLLVLIGLIVFVIGAALLREPTPATGPTAPVVAPGRPPLTQVTHATLALIDVDGVRAFDVDDRRITRAAIAELPRGPIEGAVVASEQVVLIVDHRAYALPATLEGAAVPLGPATAVFASDLPGRVWLVTTAPDGGVSARGVDLDGIEITPPAILTGGFTVKAAVPGGLVVEQLDTSGTRSLLRWDPARPASAPEPIATGAGFVAAAGDLVASRDPACTASRCDVVLHDLAAGSRHTLRKVLAPGGVAAATLHDGRLAVLDNATRRPQGTIIDTATGGAVRFRARPVPGLQPGAAWDRSGEWLFYVDDDTDIVHAVDATGSNYVVRTRPFVTSSLLSL